MNEGPNVFFFNPPRGKRYQERTTRWFGRLLGFVFYADDLKTFREIVAGRRVSWALLAVDSKMIAEHRSELEAFRDENPGIRVVVEARERQEGFDADDIVPVPDDNSPDRQHLVRILGPLISPEAG